MTQAAKLPPYDQFLRDLTRRPTNPILIAVRDMVAKDRARKAVAIQKFKTNYNEAR
jgi:hypothetical protein